MGMQTLRVLLLLLCCAVASAIAAYEQPQPTAPWAVDTFVSLEDPGGELVATELRHHCCQPAKDTAASFCSEFTIPAHDCTRLEAFLSQSANTSVAQCDCPLDGELPVDVPVQKLGVMKLRLDHSSLNRSQLIKMAAFQGDFQVVDARVDAMCERFEVDDNACAKLRVALREKVYTMELEDTKKTLLRHDTINAEAVEHAFATVSKMMETLLERSEMLRRQNEQKASAFGLLHFEAKAERNLLERRVRELEKALQEKNAMGLSEPSKRDAATRSTEMAADPVETVPVPVFSPISMRIPRVDVANFTYDRYLEFARASTPVIIQGFHLQRGSPGLPYWSLARLDKICGDATVTLKQVVTESSTAQADGPSASMWAGIQAVTKRPLRHFLQDFMHPNRSMKTWPGGLANLYLHDASVRDFCPQLLSEFTVPRYFVNDLLQKLSRSNQRDYWPSLFIGDRSTASALHADWASTAAWMGLLAGRKHWAIAKASARAALYEVLPTPDAPTQGRFEANLLDGHLARLLRPGELYEDVLEAGDVLFIPADCPHQVQNLDKTIAVAANYVDAANIDAFLRHLRTARDASSEGYDAHVRMLRELASPSSFDPSLEPRDLPFAQFKARFA